MKKIIFSFLIFTFGITLFAQELKIKNTIGANSFDFSDYDFFSHTSETDINDDTVSQNSFAIGDRFQLDFTNSFIDSRFRLDLIYHSLDDDIPAFLVAPNGYIQFAPAEHVKFIIGNNFYKTFAIDSAYLAAADDTTKYGRLLTDSLGSETYFIAGDAALFSNGLSAGISSDWNFDNDFYLELAGGVTANTDFSENYDYSIDTGFNLGLKNIFDAGFTAHNLLDDERKLGLFAGLNYIPGLILNTSFYYNFTLSDYLPEARVERSGVDEFKKQKTKYALGLSGGYEFYEIGLGIYADIISGLNDEYIGEIKYYDSNGNLISTTVTTIKRGSTIVKYKNGKAKRTDEYTAGAIPFYSQLRFSYDLNNDINFGLSCKLRTMIGDSSQTWWTFYPNVEYDLPSKLGSINTGLLLDLNLTRYNGLSGISVPISYTYKFKRKL
ncbi:MAG: hypothetical protein K5829_02570 [Treponema sp.]|nr:hypothetical protein [Treponema sp.]